MGKPAILAVGSEPEVSAVIARDLQCRYSSGCRVVSAPNIALRYCSEVVAGRGNGHLVKLTLADREHGNAEEETAWWLFVFIGASSRTGWLGADVVRDDNGFIVTGQDLLTATYARRWPLPRAPFGLETGAAGVFAAGDVHQFDSMKRSRQPSARAQCRATSCTATWQRSDAR